MSTDETADLPDEQPGIGADGNCGDALTKLRSAALHRIEQGHRAQSFGVDHIARELYISRRQLYRAFPDSGGIAALIARRRLRTAEEYLVGRPDLSLEEIAVLAGFSSAGVMRAHFRREFGMSPQHRRDAVSGSHEGAVAGSHEGAGD